VQLMPAGAVARWSGLTEVENWSRANGKACKPKLNELDAAPFAAQFRPSADKLPAGPEALLEPVRAVTVIDIPPGTRKAFQVETEFEHEIDRRFATNTRSGLRWRVGTWTALLLVSWPRFGALRRPYGRRRLQRDRSPRNHRLRRGAGLAIGWLRASGIAGWVAWCLAAGHRRVGLRRQRSLYSFYGRVALDPLVLMRMPAPGRQSWRSPSSPWEELSFAAVAPQFRPRHWARNRTGSVASVVLTAYSRGPARHPSPHE